MMDMFRLPDGSGIYLTDVRAVHVFENETGVFCAWIHAFYTSATTQIKFASYKEASEWASGFMDQVDKAKAEAHKEEEVTPKRLDTDLTSVLHNVLQQEFPEYSGNHLLKAANELATVAKAHNLINRR